MKKINSYLLVTLTILLLCLIGTGKAQVEPIPDNAINITAGVPTDITIGQGDKVWFRFIPEETREYSFYAENGWPSLSIYLESYGNIEWLSSAGNNYHSELESGKTYYFSVYNYNVEQTYSVILAEYQGLLYAQKENYSDIYVNLYDEATLRVNAAVNAGSISYTWYKDGMPIENATGATYITDEITYKTSFNCVVADDFGHSESVTFTVCVDNELTIQENMWQNISAEPEEQITLSISATVKMGKITYRWYDSEYHLIEEGNTPFYTTEPLLKNSNYSCTVADRFGNSQSIYFQITLINDLHVEARNNGQCLITPGETATLEVTASVNKGSITYEWYKEGELIENESSASYTTMAIYKTTSFSCIVRDEYGAQKTAEFTVQINTGLEAERVGPSHEIWVRPGEDAILQVSASIYWGQIYYQWYDDSGLIENANKSSYVVPNVNRKGNFYCEVRDGFGNQKRIDFAVYIDNELRFETEGRDVNIKVQPGEDVTLSVNATCNQGALTYNWESSSVDGPHFDITGPDSEISISNIQSKVGVHCSVYDEYGNEITRTFSIMIENGFTVRPKGELDRTVGFKEQVLLEVEASCDVGELTYTWYSIEPITGNNRTASFLTPEIKRDCYYTCLVRDQYNNTVDLRFQLFVDTETEGSLSAKAIDGSFRYAKLNSDVTLSLEVTGQQGEVSYFWKEGTFAPYETDIYTNTISRNAEYTIHNIQKHTRLTCYVSDESEKIIPIYYVIIVEDLIKPLQLSILTDAVMTRLYSFDFDVFSFTPDTTGTYALQLRDSIAPSVTIYATGGHESPKRYASEYQNAIEMELEKDVEYHFLISDIGKTELTFKLFQIEAAEENREVLLMTGQTVQIPVPARAGNLVEITGGDSSVLTASGNEIQANAAGTTTVSFVYENRKINYSVTVLTAESGMRFPAGLSVIEDEAFSGNQNLMFAEIDSGASNIGNRAFEGSGLLQIIIRGAQTEIAADAFGTILPQIICQPGSKAESFARQNGYDYVYLP